MLLLSIADEGNMPEYTVKNSLPTQERLCELIDYNPNTGEMTWKARDESSFVGGNKPASMSRWNRIFAGKKVGGGALLSGYMRATVDGKHHFCHRLAWKISTGIDPEVIDHLNGDKTDNRFCNLRSVDVKTNAKNRRKYKNNKSGISGVSYHARDKVWQARISVGHGRDIHLGQYNDIESAIAARMAAMAVLEYHENHGKPAITKE